jgi:uncharacterized membrane protein
MPAANEWLLKRNCSLTPRQLGCAYAVLCAGSLSVVSICAISMALHPQHPTHGAWMLFLFALLELSAVAFAFLHYARHATDHEHLALLDQQLLVERIEADRMEQIWLDACRTRVQLPADWGGLIRLEAGGIAVEVGRHVPPSRRREVARELREQLRMAALLR